jgi:hypothetical protein
MSEMNWGRKETIIWPPHQPIYTYGAIFLAVVATGLFVYLRFAIALKPLERYYLPTYIKTSIALSFRSSGKYQLLLISDASGKAWYALKSDVKSGSTPQANNKPIPLELSDTARQRGVVSLYRNASTQTSCSMSGSRSRFMLATPSPASLNCRLFLDCLPCCPNFRSRSGKTLFAGNK